LRASIVSALVEATATPPTHEAIIAELRRAVERADAYWFGVKDAGIPDVTERAAMNREAARYTLRQAESGGLDANDWKALERYVGGIIAGGDLS
jgi:hypothetical protein